MSLLSLCDAQELLALARLDMEKERFYEALMKLKQGIASKDADSAPEIFAELGRLYARLGLREKAKALFQEFLRKSPGSLNETFQLGMVHFDSGEKDQALQIWNDVLKVNATHPPALFYSALAFAQMGQVEWAREHCNRILASVETSNLYYTQARELLDQTQNSRPVDPRAGSKEPRTEH